MAELESWLDMTAVPEGQAEFVDALFGCSSRLPKLMVSHMHQAITPLL